MLTPLGRLDVASSLLRYACDYLDDLGVNVVYYESVEGHPYQDLSWDYGFIDSRRGPYIRCLFEDESYNLLINSPPAKVYFNYGDFF